MKTIYPSEWNGNYQKAHRYALVLLNNAQEIKLTSYDLVHTAYLYWLENKNEDLFTKPNRQVVSVIKNIYRNLSQGNKWYWRGQIAQKQFSSSVVNENRTEDQVLSAWNFPFTQQEVESNDTVAFLRSQLSDFDNKVLDYRIAGYQAKEIQEKEKTHNVKVTKSINNIKKAMKEVLLNPFNCSRVKVLKKISRKNYEANKAEYTDFEFGEYAEHNEYYELLTSKTNPKEGLLIKEQMRD